MAGMRLSPRFLLPALAVFFLLPAASFAYRCDFLPEKPMPPWVEKQPDIPGYYVGVGSAGKRETADDQIEASQQNALANIGKEISVSVQRVFTESVTESDTGDVQQEVNAVTETRVQELLRGAKVKEKWLDRKNCMLWTLMTVSRESVQAVQREVEEKIRRKFSSKSLMFFALENPAQPNDIQSRAISAVEKVMREIGVKIETPQVKYAPCARGNYSPLCDEKANTMFGGFEMKFDKEKLSSDKTLKARFFKFNGALYFKDRVVSGFTIDCRGVGSVSQDSGAVDLLAADSCVADIRKKLKADLQQGSE